MFRLRNNMNRSALAGLLLAGTFLTGTALAQSNTIDVGEGFEITDIQTAVNRAGPGTVIRVHPGKYAPVKITRDGITIRSTEPGGAHIVGGRQPAIESYNQSNIAVEGFRLSSDSDGVKIGGSMSGAAKNITFRNNTVEGAGGDGLKFFQTERLTLENNTIKKAGLDRNGNGDGGIDFVGVDNSTVTGNKILSTFGHACLMLKGGSDGNTIRGNSLLGCERDGITVGGFTDGQFMSPEDGKREAYNNTIEGNTVAGGTGKCPFFFNDATGNRISNNQTVGGRADCVAVDGTNNAETKVDTSDAGSDNSNDGDQYEGTSTGNMTAAAASAGNFMCSGSVASIAVAAVDSLISTFFGGGRASQVAQGLQIKEAVVSNFCLAQQMVMQGKMIASGNYNSAGAVNRGIRRTVDLTREVEGIDYDAIFPDRYGVMNRDEKIVWDEIQTKRQYDASNLSMRTGQAAAANLQTIPARSNEVIAAAQAAPGALAVGQAGVAATMMNVEVTSNLLSTQIAHNGVVEAHLDKQTAAELRAIEYRKRMRRGLPGYEGDGGLGVLMSEGQE